MLDEARMEELVGRAGPHKGALVQNTPLNFISRKIQEKLSSVVTENEPSKDQKQIV